jgi:hypothetical protein
MGHYDLCYKEQMIDNSRSAMIRIRVSVSYIEVA